MSSGPARRVSRQDIQLVQNLIERCLQLYINQKEVMETLLHQAKIEPDFTELVWQKLEEENREFFKAYYVRLMVKHQIMEFNRLLEQQVQLMRQMHPNGVASMSSSNGSIPSVPQNPVCYGTEQATSTVKLEDMPQAIGSSMPSAFSNGGSALLTNMHGPIDMSARVSRICPQPNVLSAQNSNFGVMQGMNGGLKSEPGYAGSSAYMYGADGGFLDSRSGIGSSTITPFSSVEPSSQPPSEQLMDPDHSSVGFLSQIPRNFSLSDLTVDFSQDILDSYARSPFLVRDGNNILDTRDHQGDAAGSSCLPALPRDC